MGLAEDSEAARSRLVDLQGAAAKADEAKKLNELLDELRDIGESLGQAQDKFSVLASAGIPIEAIDATAAIAKVKNAGEKFQEGGGSSGSLKTGSRWTQLIGSLTAASSSAEQKLEVAWRSYIASLYSGSSPEQLATKLPNTPENMRALEKYRALYRQLATLRKGVPASLEQLQALQRCSKQLEEIEFEFRDAPEEVRALMNAAATSGGFPLSSLTPNILDWLRQNGLLGEYAVRQRSQ